MKLTEKQEPVAWVSVSERLPEANKQCLVYWGESFGQPLLGIAQQCVPYEGDMLWHGHGGSHNEVTHWMPLPPAPGCPHPATVNQQSLTEEQIIMALENRGRRGYGPYEEGFFDGVEFAEKRHGIAAAEGKV